MTTAFAPESKSAPGPTSWLPGGNFLKFRRDPLTFFTEIQRAFGDFARFSLAGQEICLVSNPEWIEDILITSARKFHKGVALQRAKRLLGEGLLTSEGKEHLKQRRTIQPLFHRQQVQQFAETMVKHAVRWRETIADGSTIDVTGEMAALTLAIVGETLFSSNVQSDADEVRAALNDSVRTFGLAMIPYVELFEKLPLPMFVKLRHARQRLDRVIHRVIAERRASNEPRADLIAMLLAARDPENPTEPGMSDAQIRDEAMTIFLAGHETTANAMAWTWFLLASYPHVDQQLHDEIDRVLGGRVPTIEDVPKLEYTRAVVAESMRLYPPAWTMGRKAIEPHVVGDYRIMPGSVALLSQWVVHRDPRWWPEPEAFRPDRWLNASDGMREPGAGNRTRPKYSYFPFGGGSRICIGESFAWTEAILLLATIGQHWKFVTVKPPIPEPRITLRPKDLLMHSMRR